MRQLQCSAIRKMLPAYRDGELREDRALAVRGHLRSCEACAEELEALNVLGEAIRDSLHERADLHDGHVVSLHNRVVAAVQADRAQRAESWLDDLHLVWTMAGATVASVACLFAALGVMRLALREVPSSMAAVIGALGAPGSDRNPLRLDGRMPLPSLDNAVPAVVVSPDEAMLALSAIVTREGRVSQVELVMPEAGGLPHEDALLQLLDAAAQTRFEPARAGGAPVAVNVIWLMAHTTVVGKETLDTPGVRPARRLQAPAPVRRVQPPAAPISQAPASQTVAA
jgi:anti-sigma factor RsiW